MTPPTGDLAEVLRRIREDPDFLQQLRTDPKSALSSYDLSHPDLAGIDARLQSSLDGGSPLFQCDEAPPSSLDGSAAIDCNGFAPSSLDGGSPLFVCDESPASSLDGGSPLFVCDEAPASSLDGGSPLFVCNEVPAADVGAPPGGGWGPARVGLILAGAVALIAVAGLAFGVLGENNTPEPIGLATEPFSLEAPPTTDASGATSVPPGDESTTAPAPLPDGSATPPTTTKAGVAGVAAASPTTTAGATVTSAGGPSPTTTTAGNTATTAGSTNTTAAVTSATTAPTTTPTTTPTTAKPAPGPSVTGLTTNPSTIWETGPKGSCASTTTSKIGATVTDPAGVESVTLSWVVNGNPGSTLMQRVGSSNDFEAVLGAFKAGTTGPSGENLAVTVKAVDRGGRTGESATTVFLHSASEC